MNLRLHYVATDCDRSTQFMIASLIELRANNWGRREDEIATASGAGDTKNYISAEAVIQSAVRRLFFKYNWTLVITTFYVAPSWVANYFKDALDCQLSAPMLRVK